MYDKKVIDKMFVLLEEGLSQREVGRNLGVSATCVRYNTNSEHRESEKAAARKRLESPRAISLRLMKSYGISLTEWKIIRYNQCGKCAICSAVLDEMPSRKTHVDHNHATGEVRGILCNKCNAGLGYFSDNVEGLRNAIKYLER